MTYEDIKYFVPVNSTDADKVDDLVKDMLENGWRGAPILTAGEELITGSHRLAALKKINDMWLEDELQECPVVLSEEVAEDVSDILEEKEIDTIDYADIGSIFAGTWVEQYKEGIVEW